MWCGHSAHELTGIYEIFEENIISYEMEVMEKLI
jgi:hypothetical protein